MQNREYLAWLWLAPVSLVALGCRPTDLATANSIEGAKEDRVSNVSFANNRTPSEVARAALLAIEVNDKAALEKLVAVKKIKQDVQAITHGRSNFQGMIDNAIPIAVNAIASEINGLDIAGRAIAQESVTGATALVFVKGTRAGQEHTRRLFFVQEDSQWRLVPSHR